MTGKKILVVDDEKCIRELFIKMFEDTEYDLQTVETAEQALEVLKKTHIDVIFLDLRLYGMDGMELCRLVREINKISVIYAMTGWASFFEIEKCLDCGFDDFFQKPLKRETIFDAVKIAFKKLDRWKIVLFQRES